MGLLQPVIEEEERVSAGLLGSAAGGSGAAIPRLVGSTVRGARSLLSPIARADEAAARQIMAEASNPQSLLQANPSRVPGVSRSLFEESLDPGVARLETKARGMRDGQQSWVELDSRNNLARVNAIGAFAGDEADIAAAAASRDATAMPLLDTALQVRGVDKAPLFGILDDTIQRNAGRKSVKRAIEDVREELQDVGDDVAGLYNVRKSIDDLLQGRAGSDKSYAQAATKQLLDIKEALDAQIVKAAPEFGQYLDAYKAGSRPINRMETG